jgi:hypothetical protein
MHAVLVKAQAALVAAMSCGEVTPDEAAAIGSAARRFGLGMQSLFCAGFLVQIAAADKGV